MEILSIPDLLSYLQSHPHPANFKLAADVLQSRNNFLLDDLTIKEVDLAELHSRCKSLERTLANQSSQLEDACKRAQTAEDKLDFFIQAHKDLYPDRIILVSDSDDDAAAAAVITLEDGDDGKDDDANAAAVITLADGDDGKDDDANAAAVITLEDWDDGNGYLPTPMPSRKRGLVFESGSEEDEGDGDGGDKSPVPGEEDDEDDIPLLRLMRMKRKVRDDCEEEDAEAKDAETSPRDSALSPVIPPEGSGIRVSRSRVRVRRRIRRRPKGLFNGRVSYRWRPRRSTEEGSAGVGGI